MDSSTQAFLPYSLQNAESNRPVTQGEAGAALDRLNFAAREHYGYPVGVNSIQDINQYC